MEKLIIDYSLSRRKKIAAFLLGIFHVIIGIIALIIANEQNLHGVIVWIIIFYTFLGVVFLLSLIPNLHKFIRIDDNDIIVKGIYVSRPTAYRWKDIQSIKIKSNRIELHFKHKTAILRLNKLTFHDVRQVKDKIQLLATKKNIPFKKYSSHYIE